MKKLNLKYFTGSFFLSLVAVFIATKAYFVMSLSAQQNESDLNSVEAKNIELFAANEENDPIYEKYKKLSAADAPLGADSTAETITVADSTKATASEEILYAENDADGWIKEDENFVTQPQENILSTDIKEEIPGPVVALEDEEKELQIVDASVAPNFAIPLKHNYNIETGVVSVSDEADGSRIALASKNVSVYNLGTDNAAAVTEPLETEEDADNQEDVSSDNGYAKNDEDDTWSVAETANKHINKNTYGVKSEPVQQNVSLPDAETPEEKQVTYKLQPNILIPIPDDILKDENLTPQFSTSQENLKLEQELRDTHQLPELKPEERISNQDDDSDDKATNPNAIPSIDDEKDFDSEETGENEDKDDEQEDAEESQKLSDSVAAWFDGIKSKVTGDKKSSPNAKPDKKNQRSSIFQRLLGNKGDEENIVPTELKLSFQPNRAEISGQTLEWLRAFADNAVSEENVVVEIRVDRSASYEVQQKRLKLLYKILADNGVEQRKVNIMFTDREPNSFIIRNVRYATDEQRIEATKRADYPWN